MSSGGLVAPGGQTHPELGSLVKERRLASGSAVRALEQPVPVSLPGSSPFSLSKDVPLEGTSHTLEPASLAAGALLSADTGWSGACHAPAAGFPFLAWPRASQATRVQCHPPQGPGFPAAASCHFPSR